MTVDELIVKLAEYPGDTIVYVDTGYCEDREPAEEVVVHQGFGGQPIGVRIW